MARRSQFRIARLPSGLWHVFDLETGRTTTAKSQRLARLWCRAARAFALTTVEALAPLAVTREWSACYRPRSNAQRKG